MGALATVVVGAFFFAWRGPGVGIVNKRGGLRVANVEGQALPQSKRRAPSRLRINKPLPYSGGF